MSTSGPSSNIVLTRVISRMLECLGKDTHIGSSPVEQIGRSYSHINEPNIPRSPRDLSLSRIRDPNETFDEYVIPPEAAVQQLLDHFFSRLGVLWPILHRPSFMSEYSRIRVCGASCTRRSWLALFNIVLALAITSTARNDLPPSARVAEAQLYYRRAVTLCDRSTIATPSLEIGQSYS